MSILYILLPATLLAAIFERPKKPKVYRKRRQRTFGLDPGAMDTAPRQNRLTHQL